MWKQNKNEVYKLIIILLDACPKNKNSPKGSCIKYSQLSIYYSLKFHFKRLGTVIIGIGAIIYSFKIVHGHRDRQKNLF